MASERVATGDHGDYVVTGDAFAEGGIGRLFRTDSPDRVYKQYVREDRAPDLVDLERLVSIGRNVLITAGRRIGECKESSINWPVDVIRSESGTVTGVILPSIPTSCFDHGVIRGLEAMLLARAHPPRAQARIALLVRMAEILAFLDQVDLVHGDISGKNLVWSLDPAALMYLIDCDGLMPRQPPPRAGVATAGWVDPRLVEKRIPAHDHYSDRYSLALAIYRGLLLTPGNLQANQHGEWPRPSQLDKVPDETLRSMLSDALGNPLDETRRPAPAAWVNALTAAYLTDGAWNMAALGKLDATADRIANAHLDRLLSRASSFQPLPPVALQHGSPGGSSTTWQPQSLVGTPTAPRPSLPPPPGPAPVRFPPAPPPVRPRLPQARRRRWPWIAAVALLAVCVSGQIVSILRPSRPLTSGPVGTAIARWPGAPQPAGGQDADLSPSVTFDVAPPTFNAVLGGQSRYNAGYWADVTAVTPDAFHLNVAFDAHGDFAMRNPETSCLRVNSPAGRLKLAPVRVELTAQQDTHYAGTLTFPLLVSGAYAFDYSCSGDYSDAPIGQADVTMLGISRQSEEHFAVVYATRKDSDSVVLLFGSAGPHDLRDPTTSCLGDTRNPSMNLLASDRGPSTSFVGTLTFPAGSTGLFTYSCSDYPGVVV
jgi:hypothetical protein